MVIELAVHTYGAVFAHPVYADGGITLSANLLRHNIVQVRWDWTWIRLIKFFLCTFTPISGFDTRSPVDLSCVAVNRPYG